MALVSGRGRSVLCGAVCGSVESCAAKRGLLWSWSGVGAGRSVGDRGPLRTGWGSFRAGTGVLPAVRRGGCSGSGPGWVPAGPWGTVVLGARLHIGESNNTNNTLLHGGQPVWVTHAVLAPTRAAMQQARLSQILYPQRVLRSVARNEYQPVRGGPWTWALFHINTKSYTRSRLGREPEEHKQHQ